MLILGLICLRYNYLSVIMIKSSLEKDFKHLKHHKLLLAVSGGVDSMVLLHALYTLGFDILVAHCNFKLRGEDSDLDQKLVEEFCQNNRIPFESKNFELDLSKNIQLQARELRYKWFRTLLEKHNCKYITTAHHLNDKLETFFFNLSRGTGIDGLVSLQTLKGDVFRPLMGFTKAQILEYAKENQVIWREDKSNQSQKYSRNKIRHTLGVSFENLSEKAMENFDKSYMYISENKEYIDFKLTETLNFISKQVADEIRIDLQKLLALSDFEIRGIFSKYGFSSAFEIRKLALSKNNATMVSVSHKLIKYREEILLVPVENSEEKAETILIQNPLELQKILEESVFEDLLLDKLVFPLSIENYSSEDQLFLKPNHQRKKISKILKDRKLNDLHKQKVKILKDAKNRVILVLGIQTCANFSKKAYLNIERNLDFTS
ncbi:MAG: tRNA lysidine(34) synthetase TilS [Flavobacteriaceae bacterium]|nr:MAG: tRNA lysidine(34) synthetase TilS [Flavobacteriaceae bacterium]